MAEIIDGAPWAWTWQLVARGHRPLHRDGPTWLNRKRLEQRKTRFTQLAKGLAPGLVNMTQDVFGAEPDFDNMNGRELGIRYTFYRADCNVDCGPLQLIQVCYGTQHLDHDVGQALGDFTALVDAGPNSPRRLYSGFSPGHPRRPYFYTPHIHRVEFSGDGIRLVDIVGAARRHEQLFLEASAVCIQHRGSNLDTVVQVIAYGWNNFGHEHLPHPDAQPGVLFEVRGHVSTRFKAIVEREYADYAQNCIQW